MNTAIELLSNIKSYLFLTHGPAIPIPEDGSYINIGDKFTITFTCKNIAPAGTPIFFNKPRILFRETQYAVPTGGDNWHNFPKTKLGQNESTVYKAEFKAISAMPGNLPEDAVIACVYADLDLPTFFSFGYDHLVKVDIRVNT
ncbi:MAG: hypothetical protein WCK09_03320 [Bacteroidota bacterium]